MSDRRRELKRLIYGYRASQCLAAALELELFDQVAAGNRTVAALAGACGAESASLERLVAALLELGLLSSGGDGGLALTELAEAFRGEAPDSLRADARHALSAHVWRPWGRLAESIRSGEPAFVSEFGCSAWELRARDPEAQARFDAMAAARSTAEVTAVLDALALPDQGCVVDVGGGRGELLARLLDARPGLTGVLYERPEVVDGADELLRSAGVAARCRVVGGDFLREVPAGGDLYLLKAVLHNWDDSAAATILLNCRRAMTPGRRLVVIEPVAGRPWADDGELQDLHMLVMHGGRTRRRVEFEALLGAAGFRLAALEPAEQDLCLIEAAPV